MAVVGCLGQMVFQVSQEVLETIDGLEWSGSARYAVHQRHNQNALTEFTGLDPDKITFSMFLSQALGVDVMAELVKLWNYERKGESVYLVLGEKCYGKCKWNVVSHKIQAKNYDKYGNLESAEVSVELQEYLRK
ncbi:hypothetical protein D7X94_17525 [Acutalibacter sp. 1XD8-33]|uniref:phage tail protein n=1 Tax=Acutalibacter sp. 1XD8-33 TaxID=2320081 RepID=UPI000EA22154|nr:phage tail protein [Acutalibacter sp. 1XD8-33]RKJ38147.1 hypothetical protein D7X94_17525 [Acutalibacter sp. 1XD8-33]